MLYKKNSTEKKVIIYLSFLGIDIKSFTKNKIYTVWQIKIFWLIQKFTYYELGS
jgi:hypothetical protein